MKTMILAAIAVVALGMGSAFAESGNGGATAGAREWQAANGNPDISGTEWFALSPAGRAALVQQRQQRALAALRPDLAQSGNAVAQSGANPHG